MQNTLVGEEQFNAYTVQGGYSKGTGSTVDVFIELVQDPEAKFHPSKCANNLIFKSLALILEVADFGGNLLTSSIPLRPPLFGKTDIPITLAQDSVGQEGFERGILRMRIVEDSEQPGGTFFKRDLTVTIIDTNGA